MFGGLFAPEDGDARGARLKSADKDAGLARGGRGMRAENGKGIRMLAAQDQVDFGSGDAGVGERRFGDSRMVQSAQCVSPKLRTILLERERRSECVPGLFYGEDERMEHREFPARVLDINGGAK